MSSASARTWPAEPAPEARRHIEQWQRLMPETGPWTTKPLMPHRHRPLSIAGTPWLHEPLGTMACPLLRVFRVGLVGPKLRWREANPAVAPLPRRAVDFADQARLGGEDKVLPLAPGASRRHPMVRNRVSSLPLPNAGFHCEASSASQARRAGSAMAIFVRPWSTALASANPPLAVTPCLPAPP